jgi:pimeloyl-ACP methyl ester carboxylesterase
MLTEEILYKGKHIFYRKSGSGPLVMLLHGFGEDGEIWKEQYNIFPGHTLLVPDLPGSGRSEAVEDMSMEGLADVVKAIIDKEGGEAILIGHSMGGYITLAFAEKYPALLKGFGLFHSSAFADSEEKKETRQKGIRFIQEHSATEFLKTATPNLYAPSTRERHPEWIETHLEQVRNFSAGSLVSYYRSMMERPDRTFILQNSTVPVLFVMGRHDTAVPLSDGLKQCYLPQLAYIHILENSGHMGMIEESSVANAILSQFVSTIENKACT